MAEAVVIFAVERLGDLLISEAKLLRGVNGEIEEIKRELKRMQCFLREADKKQISDDRVRSWVEEMRELAFKTEDVIETFAMDLAMKKEKSGFREMLRRFACIVSEGASLHKVGKEIQTIRGELSSLSASLPTYGITKGLQEGETSNPGNLRSRRLFYPNTIEKDFIGMEKETKQIISHLKNKDTGCDVVSICGMGGQGKTTVATQIYNNDQIRSHFEAFGWVCVTQQFDREKILKSILEQLLPAEKKAQVSFMGDEVMVDELHKIQQEKYCLVVIDDIWTMDAWRDLCHVFPIGSIKSCSKILLTTRNEKVAQAGSVNKLPGLTEEEGWQLLSRKAFSVTGGSPEGVASEMENIGRQMILRCKGLPLAISTIGGMLRGKTLREWEMINRDLSFYLSKGAGIDEYHTVTRVLGLSYDSLPLRLRHCFLCLANYMEDEDIFVEGLYLFWIAEGLISSEDKAQGETMLDVAQRYLVELANRSLVQIELRSNYMISWSMIVQCRIHDLIRELCLSKVMEEKVIRIVDIQHKPEHDSKSENNRIRRLCIHPFDNLDKSSADQIINPQIRSLVLVNDYHTSNNRVENIFSLEKFKLLRILTIQGFKLCAENLKSIGKLMYLKYLSFKGCELEEFSSSIGNLRNLETLDLRVSNHNEIRIPNILWKLKQLKHLYLPLPLFRGSVKDQEKVRLNGMNELELIEGFDSKYFDIHDLIGLSKINVFNGTIRVDEENPQIIQDTLKFINCKELCYSSVCIVGDAEVAISHLILLLECYFIDCLEINARIIGVPEYDHNVFSARLTNLVLLWKCRIEEFDPMILLGKLPNLSYLCLSGNAYTGREMVCSAIGFPQLHTLELIDLPNLTNWRIDKGAMLNLSRLKIWGCNKLEMLPDGLKFLTALKDCSIYYMPTAFIDRLKATDKVEGPDFYKIRHVSSLKF